MWFRIEKRAYSAVKSDTGVVIEGVLFLTGVLLLKQVVLPI